MLRIDVVVELDGRDYEIMAAARSSAALGTGEELPLSPQRKSSSPRPFHEPSHQDDREDPQIRGSSIWITCPRARDAPTGSIIA